MNMVLITAGALLCIYLIKLGMNYFTQYYGHVIGVKMQAQMRREIFDRLQRMPLKFFDDNKTGAIMSRITNDLLRFPNLRSRTRRCFHFSGASGRILHTDGFRQPYNDAYHLLSDTYNDNLCFEKAS